MKQEITLEEALQNINNVLEVYKGTRQEHIILQQCYDKIVEELKPKEVKK